MSSPLKDALIKALLPVCLENTRLMRDKYESKPESPEEDNSRKILTAYLEKLRKEYEHDFSDEFVEMVIKIASIIANNKETIKIDYSKIGQDKTPVYDPLSVVYLQKDGSGHKMKEKFAILMHGRNRHILKSDGGVGSYDHNLDEVRLATDKEVEVCIYNLTTEQIQRILRDTLFSSVVSSLI